MQRTADLVRRVVRTTGEQDVPFLAAAVAYYAFVSVLPTVVLLFVVATALGSDRLADVFVSASAGLLTDTGQQFVLEAIENGAGRGGTTLFSVLLAVWGSLKVFRGIDTAFEDIYGVASTSSFLDQLKESLIVAVSVGVSLLVMFALGSALVALELDGLVGLLGIVVLPLVLTATFLPMYYVFPEPDVSLREVLPGAVFAGVGWAVLQAGFQAYVELQASGGGGPQVYGAIGAVLLLITWLYFGALVVLIGVVVNVALASDRRLPARTDAESGPGTPVGDGRGVRGVSDRHHKGDTPPAKARMSGEADEDGPAPDITELDRRVAALRADLDDIDDRTVEKPALESELKRYVRARMRRSHARGWGPYLVLLYGVVLTLGAFYWLDGWVAIAAMLILFLSTLGLYTLFIVVGVGLNLLDVPGKTVDAIRRRR